MNRIGLYCCGTTHCVGAHTHAFAAHFHFSNATADFFQNKRQRARRAKESEKKLNLPIIIFTLKNNARFWRDLKKFNRYRPNDTGAGVIYAIRSHTSACSPSAFRFRDLFLTVLNGFDSIEALHRLSPNLSTKRFGSGLIARFANDHPFRGEKS